MNRKFFTGLIILMGISILGIIAVQLVWMNNAIRVKNELFNRSVNEALNNTVNKLEDLHNFGVVNQMVFDNTLNRAVQPDMVNETEGVPMPPPPSPRVAYSNSSVFGTHPPHVVRHLKPGEKPQRVEIKVNTSKDKKGTFRYEIKTESETDINAISDDIHTSGNAVFIFDTDTVITDVDSMYKISLVKIDSMITTLDTFNIIRPEISHRAQLKAGRLKRMANQVVTEISEWDVRDIDEEQIQTVLEEELLNRNIPIPFEYGIFRDSVLINKQPVADSLNLL